MPAETSQYICCIVELNVSVLIVAYISETSNSVTSMLSSEQLGSNLLVTTG